MSDNKMLDLVIEEVSGCGSAFGFRQVDAVTALLALEQRGSEFTQAWRTVDLPSFGGIHFVETTWVHLHALVRQCRPFRELYGSQLDVRWRSAVQEPSAVSIFKPPLWLFPHLPDVVCPIAAKPWQELGVADEHKDVAWAIACEVEELLWAAIKWQITDRDFLETNPFMPLVDLISGTAVFPIGLIADRFWWGGLRGE